MNRVPTSLLAVAAAATIALTGWNLGHQAAAGGNPPAVPVVAAPAANAAPSPSPSPKLPGKFPGPVVVKPKPKPVVVTPKPKPVVVTPKPTPKPPALKWPAAQYVNRDASLDTCSMNATGCLYDMNTGEYVTVLSPGQPVKCDMEGPGPTPVGPGKVTSSAQAPDGTLMCWSAPLT